MRRAVKVVIFAAVVFFVVAPIIPTPNGEIVPFQLAGFFPRFESLSCALLHEGIAIGPISFQGSWTVSDGCAIGWP